MGNLPEYEAKLIIEDGIETKELAKSYLVQVDVEVSEGKTLRLFVDATNIVNRANDRTLPKSGEYWLDSSEGWFEKYGDKKS